MNFNVGPAEILRSGPKAWNAWRDSNPAEILNLTGIALALSERQMGPAQGGPINLKSVCIRESFLRFATLTAADLENADMDSADLVHARFQMANLKTSSLRGAQLDHADFAGALLNKAKLSHSSLRSANFTGADLQGADLCDADLQSASFDRSNLRDANLSNALLDYSDMAGADLLRTNLCGANLYHAKNLTEDQLRGSLRDQFTILPADFDGSFLSKPSRSVKSDFLDPKFETAAPINQSKPGQGRIRLTAVSLAAASTLALFWFHNSLSGSGKNHVDAARPEKSVVAQGQSTSSPNDAPPGPAAAAFPSSKSQPSQTSETVTATPAKEPELDRALPKAEDSGVPGKMSSTATDAAENEAGHASAPNATSLKAEDAAAPTEEPAASTGAAVKLTQQKPVLPPTYPDPESAAALGQDASAMPAGDTALTPAISGAQAVPSVSPESETPPVSASESGQVDHQNSHREVSGLEAASDQQLPDIAKSSEPTTIALAPVDGDLSAAPNAPALAAGPDVPSLPLRKPDLSATLMSGAPVALAKPIIRSNNRKIARDRHALTGSKPVGKKSDTPPHPASTASAILAGGL